MWDQDHGLIPNALASYFKPISGLHGHNTRMVTAGKLSVDIPIRTDTHGKKVLKFTGPRIFNTLKDLTFYGSSKTKRHFVKQHKNI